MYWVILLRPYSPSRLSAWRRGHDARHQLHDDRGVDVRVHARAPRPRSSTARRPRTGPAARTAGCPRRRRLSCVRVDARAPARRPAAGRRSAGPGHRGSGAGCPARGRRSAAIRTRVRRRRRTAVSVPSASAARRHSVSRRRPLVVGRPRPTVGLGRPRSFGGRAGAGFGSRSCRLAAPRRPGSLVDAERRERRGRDLEDVDAAAGGLDLGPGRRGERIGDDEERHGQFAGAEDLERLVQASGRGRRRAGCPG